MGLKYQVTYTKDEISDPPIDIRWFHAFFSDREFLSQAYGPDVWLAQLSNHGFFIFPNKEKHLL